MKSFFGKSTLVICRSSSNRLRFASINATLSSSNNFFVRSVIISVTVDFQISIQKKKTSKFAKITRLIAQNVGIAKPPSVKGEPLRCSARDYVYPLFLHCLLLLFFIRLYGRTSGILIADDVKNKRVFCTLLDRNRVFRAEQKRGISPSPTKRKNKNGYPAFAWVSGGFFMQLFGPFRRTQCFRR